MKNQLAFAAAIAADLAARRGEVMLSADLADELHLSSNALRLILSRGGDVPRPAALPGKGHRWLTRDVAAWLAARSAHPVEVAHEAGDGLSAPAGNPDAPRRPGRPRKTQQLHGTAGGAP